MRLRKQRLLCGLLAVVGSGAVNFAYADTMLAIDLNQFDVDVSAPVGLTRTLTLTDDANTLINSIAIDGVLQTLSSTTVTDWTGTMTTTGTAAFGTVTGSFTLTDDNGDTYSVSGLSGTYFDTLSPNGVIVSALTGGGLFSSNDFQGVDVSDFNAAEPLGGSILQFFLDPSVFSGGGSDADVDADILVVVPLPMAGWMGLSLLGSAGAFGFIKKRRSLQPAI